MNARRTSSVFAFCFALAIAFLSIPFAAQAQAPERKFSRELVVSANPYASDAGLKILREGGSAVDAVLAG